MKRKVNAIWNGSGANGNGLLTAQSGAFNKMPYSFKRGLKMIMVNLEQILRNLSLRHLLVVSI